MNRTTIADRPYRAMLTAAGEVDAYLKRAPGLGMDIINYLVRRDWIKLHRERSLNKHGQVVWETRGGWITPLGLSCLRQETARRGDTMPDPRTFRVPAQRSVTALVDPFALVASGRPAEIPLPF